MNIALLYKSIGKTPLETINEFKYNNNKNNPHLFIKKIAYAGRLDPMAHGLLLALYGDNIIHQEKFFNLNKTYYFNMLFGFSTDTYDILGIPSFNNNIPPIKNIIFPNTGSYTQSYPPFSSFHINGIPLWQHSLNNNIHNISIPSKNIHIFKFKIIYMKYISIPFIAYLLMNRFSKLSQPHKFRLNTIISLWSSLLKNIFSNNKNLMFPLIKAKVKVSSGTYIRSITHNIGIDNNTSAIAFDIFRTKIGKYKLNIQT